MEDKTDFLRRLPDSKTHFSKSKSVWLKLHIDPILLLLVFGLTLFGLFVLYSASGQNISMLKRQVVFYFIAYCSMFIIAQLDMKFLQRGAPWFYVIGIVLLALVYVVGVSANGATRWLSLGVIRFQPSEALKIAVPASGLIVLFLAGLRWRYIIGSVALLAASAWPIWQFVLQPYQGWLNGTQSQLDFLPESHTDFIIAVLAEEFGLIGVIFLLSIYFAIVARGLIIAWKARSTFNRLLAGSVILTFFVYVFVNVSMVAGLLPVVGVPLPLVSLGGTSLITLLLLSQKIPTAYAILFRQRSVIEHPVTRVMYRQWPTRCRSTSRERRRATRAPIKLKALSTA